MATWILVIFAHVGGLGSGNSNALTSVVGFQTKEACVTAGTTVAALANGTVKDINYACVKDR